MFPFSTLFNDKFNCFLYLKVKQNQAIAIAKNPMLSVEKHIIQSMLFQLIANGNKIVPKIADKLKHIISNIKYALTNHINDLGFKYLFFFIISFSF